MGEGDEVVTVTGGHGVTGRRETFHAHEEEVWEWEWVEGAKMLGCSWGLRWVEVVDVGKDENVRNGTGTRMA